MGVVAGPKNQVTPQESFARFVRILKSQDRDPGRAEKIDKRIGDWRRNATTPPDYAELIVELQRDFGVAPPPKSRAAKGPGRRRR